MDQVLYLASTSASEMSGVNDTFHFVFLFSIDKVWKRVLKVAPMELRLLIWCKEIHMKHRVYAPLFWKMELVCHRSQYFGDGKGAISFRCQLCNIIFQGSGFTRSEVIDRTFPKCSTRDKVNGMIPRLVLWEMMGGLFTEYFSVHAVLDRNLNKRSRRGKVSSKLSRGSGFGRYLEEIFFD